MDKAEFAGLLALVFFGTILFTPIDSGIWKFFLLLGIVFGAIWWFKK